jgi:hypothetical protein
MARSSDKMGLRLRFVLGLGLVLGLDIELG